MLQQDTTTDQILQVVRSYPECTLDELTQRLPELAWSDVFLGVDRLSRSGHLLLSHNTTRFVTTIRALY